MWALQQLTYGIIWAFRSVTSGLSVLNGVKHQLRNSRFGWSMASTNDVNTNAVCSLIYANRRLTEVAEDISINKCSCHNIFNKKLLVPLFHVTHLYLSAIDHLPTLCTLQTWLLQNFSYCQTWKSPWRTSFLKYRWNSIESIIQLHAISKNKFQGAFQQWQKRKKQGGLFEGNKQV